MSLFDNDYSGLKGDSGLGQERGPISPVGGGLIPQNLSQTGWIQDLRVLSQAVGSRIKVGQAGCCPSICMTFVSLKLLRHSVQIRMSSTNLF